MLKRSEQAKQRWGGLHNAIDKWLHERQDVLVGYFQLAGLPPYQKDSHQLPSVDAIRDFCALLMDYISAGHFEVYDQIVNASASQAKEMLKLADELYPKIAETTDTALRFNDTYGEATDKTDFTHFDEALSQLGEAIELRMEYEDQLLATLDEQELIKA